ncbi:hypothetical protein VNO78_18204 [Psophocarpus tetragonolobus]|uniref:Uncharacterized protein n=1 Tax=Psophocarpus tetragonolobus TaxID=3891 RepID=A0AAN9SHY0_PSOTE
MASEETMMSFDTESESESESDDKSFDADGELSSESEKELGRCYSLASTLRGRSEYASDNGNERKKSDDRRRRRKQKEKEGESGVVLITRPKGGKRSLCMDLDEVKACRDLGFELEHQRMLEIPSHRLSSPLDTSSGANSPIANWRISAPGDDPRHVKARLKVWAQAVALASASKYSS